MARPVRSSRRVLPWGIAAVGALATVMGCSLLNSLDGLTGGDATSPLGEAGADGDGGSISDVSTGSDVGTGADTSGRPRAWRALAVSGPPARHSVRMAYDDARQKAVLFGGGETWEWNGSAWSRTGNGPSGRSVGLVYDSARRLTVLSGGAGTSREPWEYNGVAWTKTAPAASGPAGLFAPALAYDRARSVVVSFGGFDTATSSDNAETWEWSPGAGFVRRSLERAPPGRAAHVMVYDAARSRVVLFGGSAGRSFNDVWEYDGNTWTEGTPATSPPPRLAACAAYDAGRGVTVVFGGRDEDKTSALSDTWEWNGTSWRQGPGGPPARRTCAMAFDAARNAIVMYGGSPGREGNTSLSLGDTWVYE